MSDEQTRNQKSETREHEAGGTQVRATITITVRASFDCETDEEAVTLLSRIRPSKIMERAKAQREKWAEVTAIKCWLVEPNGCQAALKITRK